MNAFQKTIKYLAMAFAIFLTVNIIGGILSVVGLFGGLFDGFSGREEATGDLKTYEISADIHSLTIDLQAADFTVKQGTRFSVESNLRHLSVEEKNGMLKIEDEKLFSGKYSGAVLTLYIPESAIFDEAKISAGAGRMTIEALSAKRLDLDLGAGEATIDKLAVTEITDIDGGLGKLTIADGVLHNLDLDMGIGQLILTAALSGNSRFDMGVGASRITVLGSRADYRLNIDKGIGGIEVDGAGVSDIKESHRADHQIEINGGVGSVSLAFKK